MRAGVKKLAIAFGVAAIGGAAFWGLTDKGRIGGRVWNPRTPTSVTENIATVGELQSYLAGLEKRLPELESSHCAEFLNGVTADLYQLNPQTFDREALMERSTELIRDFFQLRLTVRGQLARFHQKDEYPRECSDAARSTLRVLRFVEEYLAEMKVRPEPYDAKKPAPYLAGTAPSLMLNPDYVGFDVATGLKSGDLLVSRGNAFTSAAIARLADIDGQFSHVALLYIDEKTGARHVVEAHIEVGSTVRTFNTYVADQNFRVMVLRQPDAKLAHEAARLMYERVKRASDSGVKVPYDFGMNLKDDRELFCSEIAHVAYKQASNGEFVMPLHLSSYRPNNRDFIDRLGISELDSFAPSDLEVDPRFDVVAEWRDLRRINSSHIKDATLNQLYVWMEHEGYTFKSSPNAWFRREVIWRVRRWPLFGNLLKEKFPLNMSQNVLEVITLLNDVAEVLYDHLEEKNVQQLKQTGFSMGFETMLQTLENFRVNDLERHRVYLKWMRSRHLDPKTGQFPPGPPGSKFHGWFRAGE